MLKLQELLARGQGLHVEGVIGVLGGRAESLGKTNEKRGGGQKPCVRVGRPEASRRLLQPGLRPRQLGSPGAAPLPRLGAPCLEKAGCAQCTQFTLIRKN